MRCLGISPARRAGAALLAAPALALALAGAAASPSAAATTSRVSLPSPNTYGIPGTPSLLDPSQRLSLRVYLAGQHPAQMTAVALATATPGNARYARSLTPDQYQATFGASAAQVAAVTGWLTGQGMTVTGSTAHYIAVQGTAAEVNSAFGTTVSQYVTTTVTLGHTIAAAQAGVVGGFSVPAALGGDVAAVTGIDETTVTPSAASAASTAQLNAARTSAARASSAARVNAVKASAAAGTATCSHYWGQRVTPIPAAYGHTAAPTTLCGYTPGQLRKAYRIGADGYTGKGETIAVVLNEAWPTMESDANQFFASNGIAGFAAGRYTENFDSGWAATCGAQQAELGISPDPEEAIDVETAHIAAPDANLVLVAADCDPSYAGESPLVLQDYLDATTRIVDNHLADVVSSSWGLLDSYVSPADVAAWNLVFEQGALEGIGFNYSSGDDAAATNVAGAQGMVAFPAADPWVTAVGGTTLAIGQHGAVIGQYPWSDYVTQVDDAGTSYTSPLPGDFQAGSGGDVTTLFTEPGYQRAVVPAALAVGGGTGQTNRVVPDISANAGAAWLVGYTGAITDGVYDEANYGGGTSGASPMIAGLEAGAMQAAGHALGFANPALYQLSGSSAITDITPVDPNRPPVFAGDSAYFGAGNYLDTVGLDSPPLASAAGYDDVTGLGAPGDSFVTAFSHLRT